MSTYSVSGFAKLYDLNAVKAQLAGMQERESPALRRLYDTMIRKGDTRWLTGPTTETDLDALAQICPNFELVVRDLKKYIALALYGNQPFNFMPILLAGDPGVGKTHFARLLASYLKTEYQYISMASVSAGFILSGSASTWAGAKTGKVASALVNGSVANPLILLDEMDKASGSHQHDPLGSLYQLFERDTAKGFVDEFLDVPLDASNVIWVGTANNLKSIPAPILSRMAVYEVPAPTSAQAAVIVGNLYSRLIEENGWQFDPVLSDDVISKLATVSPREMRKQILDALGSARLSGRTAIIPEDVELRARTGARSIGFHA